MRRILLLLLATLAAACGSSGDHAPNQTEWTASLGRTYELTWKAAAGKLEVNEPTSLRVEVRTLDGTPLEGAEVVLRGSMPGHGHGMNREPRSRELGGGVYLVEGVLLHMTGTWELKFDVLHDGVAESVVVELVLE